MTIGGIEKLNENNGVKIYETQGLCEHMVNVAIKNPKLKEKFDEYKQKVTRFSPEFEFCLHELGFFLKDPFCTGSDDIMFSNGNRTYIANKDYLTKNNLHREDVKNDRVGYEMLTDEYVGYVSNLDEIDKINEGIVDSKGFVSSKFIKDKEALPQLLLLNEIIKSKEAYDDYINHFHEYEGYEDYMTSKDNCIHVSKNNNGKFNISFVSENDGKVLNFIQNLEKNNLIEELTPVVRKDSSVMRAA